MARINKSVSKVKSVLSFCFDQPCSFLASTLFIINSCSEESGARVGLALAINIHITIIKSMNVAQLNIIIWQQHTHKWSAPQLPSLCVKWPPPSRWQSSGLCVHLLPSSLKAFLKPVTHTTGFHGYVDGGKLSHDRRSTHDVCFHGRTSPTHWMAPKLIQFNNDQLQSLTNQYEMI